MLNKEYELVTAKNGQQAIAVAMSERPDLILLDVVMPIMGGFEACKEIRAKTEIGNTPIIMVTTRGDEHSMETGFQMGAMDYVTKPIDSLELISKSKTILATNNGRVLSMIKNEESERLSRQDSRRYAMSPPGSVER